MYVFTSLESIRVFTAICFCDMSMFFGGFFGEHLTLSKTYLGTNHDLIWGRDVISYSDRKFILFLNWLIYFFLIYKKHVGICCWPDRGQIFKKKKIPAKEKKMVGTQENIAGE